MAYVLAFKAQYAVKRSTLPKLDATKADGIRQDYHTREIIRGRPVASWLEFCLIQDLATDSSAAQYTVKRRYTIEKYIEALKIVKNLQDPSARAKLDLSDFSIVEVPDIKPVVPPKMISTDDYRYNQWANSISIKSKSRRVTYCIKCRHIIPKDMTRLAINQSWAVCPLCVNDMADTLNVAINSYDATYVEEMRVTRALGNL